ncbi:hypothetical protein [Acinetobacter pollinis]|uniref:hypothetical protein n=1 Tax=Acinetobacter pollinis TaxID=2605270 RepID=UPI0018A314DD|nr:hypothetical protein [Acinetobacter pollinis]MBF7691713.1 hypothetical protein [Acinetobacter pollinis]MBF7699331.1 hypothetical protein [Acinetobacter pollinis]
MSSTQKRIRDDLLEKVEDMKWEIKYELRMEITETDIINSLIYHHLKNLRSEEVLEWRKKYLGKDE